VACVARTEADARHDAANFSLPGSSFANRERRYTTGGGINGKTRGRMYLVLFPVSHGGDAGSFDGPPNQRASRRDKEKRCGGKLDEGRKRLRAVRDQDGLASALECWTDGEGKWKER